MTSPTQTLDLLKRNHALRNPSPHAIASSPILKGKRSVLMPPDDAAVYQPTRRSHAWPILLNTVDPSVIVAANTDNGIAPRVRPAGIKMGQGNRTFARISPTRLDQSTMETIPGVSTQSASDTENAARPADASMSRNVSHPCFGLYLTRNRRRLPRSSGRRLPVSVNETAAMLVLMVKPPPFPLNPALADYVPVQTGYPRPCPRCRRASPSRRHPPAHPAFG